MEQAATAYATSHPVLSSKSPVQSGPVQSISDVYFISCSVLPRLLCCPVQCGPVGCRVLSTSFQASRAPPHSRLRALIHFGTLALWPQARLVSVHGPWTIVDIHNWGSCLVLSDLGRSEKSCASVPASALCRDSVNCAHVGDPWTWARTRL